MCTRVWIPRGTLGSRIRRHPTSPGTSSMPPSGDAPHQQHQAPTDNLDELSRRRRRRDPWGLRRIRGALLCREEGGSVACACFFWKARMPALELFVQYMSWSFGFALPQLPQTRESTVAYLTPFTCLQGSVWRISRIRAMPPESAVGVSHATKRFLLAHQAFTCFACSLEICGAPPGQRCQHVRAYNAPKEEG